jgi:hypothetical protein
MPTAGAEQQPAVAHGDRRYDVDVGMVEGLEQSARAE